MTHIDFHCINPETDLHDHHLYICDQCGTVVAENGLDDTRRLTHRHWHQHVETGLRPHLPHHQYLPSIAPTATNDRKHRRR